MSDKHKFPIKVFVFGTLRKRQRLEYYMDGSIFAGMYYTEGQLMKSESGNAYIDFKQKGVATKGELYYMTYSGLLRINHLESTSGEFPKAYDLQIVPIWKQADQKFDFNPINCTFAFVYKLRNEPEKIDSGDWILQINPLHEIEKFIQQSPDHEADAEELIQYLHKIMIK
jgi:gamma-glutamylcyclotransferase (GGCT)/AIG2-like uncharacterized protein YtfP